MSVKDNPIDPSGKAVTFFIAIIVRPIPMHPCPNAHTIESLYHIFFYLSIAEVIFFAA